MNKQPTHCRRRGFRSRKGAILVLAAVGMIILLVGAAFSVDIAYMQLTREELHIATDAAAKAAVAKLSLGGTPTEAKNAAIACAAANTVAGRPLVIDASCIALGKVTYYENGHWPFVVDGTPNTAAKVDVTMSRGTSSGAVNLFFGKVMGTQVFCPAATSTAAFVRNKVCLCLDRSHSMCFDLSGTSWRYPSPSGYLGEPKSSNKWSGYKVLPNLTGSRWLTLSSAINTFLNTVALVPVETRVGLVTWGSYLYEGRLYPAHTVGKVYWPRSPETPATTEETKDEGFVTDFSVIRSKVSARNSAMMHGGTNMQAGMDAAIAFFGKHDDHTPWNKVMILFSDGQWTDGNDPATTSAITARANNIVVHTVGLLTDAGNTTLQDIATVTGGRYFRATNAAELEAAFQEIARLLPVILTQ